MERRLLIAFLLSTLLIMAYQMFYYGPRLRRAQELKRAQQEHLEAEQQSSRPVGADVVERQQPETEVEQPETEVREDVPAVSGEEAKHITVTTDLYEITLTTMGAEIVSGKLFAFETNGEPVQLIARGEKNDGAMTVTLSGETRQYPLEDLQFEAYLSGVGQPLTDGRVITVDQAGGEKTIVFRAGSTNGQRIERSYTFVAGQYLLRTGIRFASGGYPFARSIVWGFGPGLRATEAKTKDDYEAMRASLRLGEEHYKKKPGDFDENYSGTVQWAALQTKYFTTVMVPETPIGGEAVLKGIKDANSMTASIKLPANERRGTVDQMLGLYVGPLDYKRLKVLGRGLEKNVDIGFNHVAIFKPVSVAILWSMLTLYKVIPNYGIVIIIISVLTKVLFYRLTHKSFKSMRDMQALQPKLQALKEKYKDDRQKLSQETMKLYKEGGVNPLGGCLPMLLQMPVFIALFSVLRSTIEVRQAPFVGWMNDLSQQDVLFTLPFSLPLIGAHVSVLPVLMGASMLFQSKIGGSVAGPSSTTTQPKAFVYMLPIVFTLLFYRMPSGLVLYWLVNTVLSVGQQYYINKGAAREEQEKAENEKALGEKREAKPSGRTKPPKKKAKKG